MLSLSRGRHLSPREGGGSSCTCSFSFTSCPSQVPNMRARTLPDNRAPNRWALLHQSPLLCLAHCLIYDVVRFHHHGYAQLSKAGLTSMFRIQPVAKSLQGFLSRNYQPNSSRECLDRETTWNFITISESRKAKALKSVTFQRDASGWGCGEWPSDTQVEFCS